MVVSNGSLSVSCGICGAAAAAATAAAARMAAWVATCAVAASGDDGAAATGEDGVTAATKAAEAASMDGVLGLVGGGRGIDADVALFSASAAGPARALDAARLTAVAAGRVIPATTREDDGGNASAPLSEQDGVGLRWTAAHTVVVVGVDDEWDAADTWELPSTAAAAAVSATEAEVAAAAAACIFTFSLSPSQKRNVTL